MKKIITLFVLPLFIGGVFAFQSVGGNEKLEKFSSKAHASAGGNQAGLTGATEENNCTQCHSGSVLDGSTENQILVYNSSFQQVTTYVPGETYTISLQMASNPSKKGFSATILENTNNNKVGTTAGMAIGGTTDFSNAGQTRDYVSHTGASNTSDTSVWTWNWTAPVSDEGPVTIYLASNSANNDGGPAGDAIYLSERILNSTLSLSEQEVDATNFVAGYSSDGNNVTVRFNSEEADNMNFNLVDMNGRSVYHQDLSTSIIGGNTHTITLPEEIKNGLYIVHFFVGNKAMSSNLVVNK